MLLPSERHYVAVVPSGAGLLGWMHVEHRVRSNVARELSHPFYESLGYERAKTQHVYRKTLAGPPRGLSASRR
jgi:hypothetical protein